VNPPKRVLKRTSLVSPTGFRGFARGSLSYEDLTPEELAALRERFPDASFATGRAAKPASAAAVLSPEVAPAAAGGAPIELPESAIVRSEMDLTAHRLNAGADERQIRPPAPEDFQITDADISRFDDREKRLNALGPKLSFGLAAAIVAIAGLTGIDWKWMFSDGLWAPSTYFALFGLLVGWLLISLFGTLFAGLLVVFPLTSFALNRTPSAVAVLRYKSAVTEFRAWLDRTRREWWVGLSGLRFEQELARLFCAIGWEATPTRASGDGGIDIAGKRAGLKFIVQCKNHKLPIGPAAARELYGTLRASHSRFAILASLSGFTKGVVEFVKGKRIELIDLNWIIRQQMQLDATWKPRGKPLTRSEKGFVESRIVNPARIDGV
jgi:hypothetical protein